MKIFRGRMNKSIANVANLHTCAVGGVDLVVTLVLLTGSQAIKLPRDVVSGAGVDDLSPLPVLLL